MIRRLLVADRGEIARRVFATCRLVGIETVAVYSDVDTDAPHVNEADYAVHLEGNTPATTYLEQHALIAAAKRAGANAVHPGNGVLAEDPVFAAAVVDAGMIWVGPPAATLRTLHRKTETKKLVAEAKVPVLPSFTDPETVPGFPVLIKPDAGIGGAGMRVVRDASTLAEAVASTRREVDGEVFCEPYVPNVRHIEVPILADAMGAVVPFGERECSVQRRYQKIVEETPSPAVDAALREDLCRAAIVAVRALGFVGAGAVEFLLDADGDFWFLELTPTLQTDHAVTECTSGYDLVRLQLLVAEGGSLPMPGPPPIRGHAIEVRICAEDPAYAWLPSAGTLHRFAVPDVAGAFRPLPQPGLRLDSGVADGSVTGMHHDPMLAKLIAWAPSRQEAARMLASALARAQLHGVVTNRDLLVRTLRHHSFRAGDIDTGFLDRHPEVFAPLLSSVDAVRLSCLASALAGAADRRASAPVLSSLPSGWRNVPSGSQTAVYDGPTGPVEVGYRMNRHGELAGWWVRSVDPEELDLAGLGQEPVDEHPPIVVVSARRDRVVLNVQGIRLAVLVHRVGDVSYVDSPEGSVTLREISRFPLPAPEAAESSLIAPLPGAVRRVLVVPGQRVRAGELLLTLEAMKLEHPVHAPSAGVVASLPVHPGAEVDTGELLAVLDPE
ncbi:acetyl/propionyl-CoA carboxylase subuit alpha [Actinoplanes ianthinogenes]|uniref:Acetyl/propionyl-CoA carboxylase subuit alpha n=1 Tax=Actinoplanes ianthinogenes TaxID=122358 RepID=A0ABM7LVE5_9ACTN|nr:biotin carboxylase N-terminal domain-containing protein [Actinoplanes ianthinogenes]BCJ43315.1 acetyl/propionyl-CoA carboxylase subuit alpha [Actinoplanes ianthinogenes]GGR20956.1 acetyl/propionyl-CoA carboxylase subuit alpha [Actinoplanes ianthinogenes]